MSDFNNLLDLKLYRNYPQIFIGISETWNVKT
jgi:hypothetical protein